MNGTIGKITLLQLALTLKLFPDFQYQVQTIQLEKSLKKRWNPLKQKWTQLLLKENYLKH